MASAATQKADTVLTILKDVVIEVATLARPVTAAAVAGLILTLIPGVGLDATTLAAILVGVGGADAVVENVLGIKGPPAATPTPAAPTSTYTPPTA